MDTTILARYLDTLHCVVEGISSRGSFRSTLQEILTALAEHLDFERPHIVVQDPESLNPATFPCLWTGGPPCSLRPGKRNYRTSFCWRAGHYRFLHAGSLRFS